MKTFTEPIKKVLSFRKFILQRAYCSSLSEKKINIEGKNLTYVASGQGSKAVLLMPGALGTAETDFRPQLEKLPHVLPNYKIIAWNPPGYGNSRPPDRSFTIDFFEQDSDFANKLMNKLGLEKYSILGWSDGGITGMVLAATQPEAIEQLVVWGSNAYILPEELKLYQGIRDVSQWSKRMREPMEKVYGKEYFPKLWAEWVDIFLEIYDKKGGDLCKNHLKNIKCPTLILHGSKDPMIAPEHVPYLLNNIKGADIHVFPEGKHNIHLRYPDEFNKIVADFLLKA